MAECIFCEPPKQNILFEQELWVCMFDNYPVSKGHLLIIPKRHVRTYFDLTEEEKTSLHLMLDKAKAMLDEEYHPNGYNIGANCGEASGQTIPHCHIHVIPRYNGDVEDPRGGVRGVIPNKQKYEMS